MKSIRAPARVAAVSLAVAVVIGAGIGAGAGQGEVRHGAPGFAKLAADATRIASKTVDRNKEVVLRFVNLAWNHHRPAQAARAYLAPGYIEHAPYSLSGRDGFIQSATQYTTAYPALHYDVRRVIAQGDLVFTHSQRSILPADRGNDCRGAVVGDIYRLNAAGKIVEHWSVTEDLLDTMRQIPCPNSAGLTMTDGPATDTSRPSDLAANAQAATGLLNIGWNQRQPQQAADLYLDGYIEHNPGSQGADGFVRDATGAAHAFPGLYLDFKKVIAEGDMVAIFTHWTIDAANRGNDKRDVALIDVFRLNQDSKVVEHWDMSQPIPPITKSGNSMLSDGPGFPPPP